MHDSTFRSDSSLENIATNFYLNWFDSLSDISGLDNIVSIQIESFRFWKVHFQRKTLSKVSRSVTCYHSMPAEAPQVDYFPDYFQGIILEE